MGKLAEKEAHDLIRPLIMKQGVRKDVISLFVKGNLLHAHQFSKADLIKMGFDIKDFDIGLEKLVYDLITGNANDSVNYA
jgi:hypothetical protein